MIVKFSVSFEEEVQKLLENGGLQTHAAGMLKATNLVPMLVYGYMCRGTNIAGWGVEPFSNNEKFEQVRGVIDQADRIESVVSLREGVKIRVDVFFFGKQGKELSIYVLYTFSGNVEQFGVY